MTENDWLDAHTEPMEDEEQAARILDALASRAIARAIDRASSVAGSSDKTVVKQWDDLDGPLEEVLADSEFRKAALDAANQGFFFPPSGDYTIEELDAEADK
jgi:hypothetical protein